MTGLGPDPHASPFKGRSDLRRIWNALLYSIAGLRAAYRHEFPFRLECAAAAVLIPASLFMPTSGIGKAMLAGSVLLVMLAELINSAIEAAVDRISLERHPLSKRAKDIGSAIVLIALIHAAMVWALVLFG